MSNKKNFAYAVSANLLSTFVSALITLLLPKVISVDSYGYFQYYLFWAGYLGILHFGWIDGLYLVYCGEYYENIRKEEIAAQIRLFLFLQSFLGACIVVISILFFSSADYRFIFSCIGVLLVITNFRLFLLYILQATARIKEYSIATISGLLAYVAIIMVLLWQRIPNYSNYIYANIISLAIPMLIGIYYCRDIFFEKPVAFDKTINQSKEFISIGSKLLIANFASAWIIGVARIMIERQWDIGTFGKISLTITISNMFMTFINAIALVLLPMLRRMDENRLVPLYSHLNTLLLSVLFGGMIFYYPVQKLLSLWLPEYADSLKYMALLFPICVFESKNAMILNTYLKALRKENVIMIINVFTVGISAILSFIAINLFHNLTLSMLFIVIAIGTRCIIFELFLNKNIEINAWKNVSIEIIMSILFILCNWNIGGLLGLLIYILFYSIYIVFNRKEIIHSYQMLLVK